MKQTFVLTLMLFAIGQSLAMPDLTGLEPVVVEQLKEAQSEVERTAREPGFSPAEKAASVGSLGHLYHTYGFLDAAADAYATALELDTKSFLWHYAAATVAGKQGNFQKALDSYQQALDLADSVNRQYLASIRLGETYKTLNDLDMAEDAYRVALDLGTGGAAVHARLGELYLVTEDYEQSVEHLSRALSINPDASQLHYPLAMAYRGLGQRDLAMQHLSRRGKVRSEPGDPLPGYLDSLLKGYRGHIVAARIALSGNQFADAAASLKIAMQEDATRPFTWVLLAEANIGLERPREAVSNLEQALRLDANELTAHAFLGRVLMEMGESAKAIPHLEQFASSNPYSADAALDLARAFQDAGRIDDAIATYDQSLDLDPSQVEPWLELILLLTNASKHELALTKSELAAEKLPNEPKILARLVFSLAAAPDEAIRNGERAVVVAERLFEIEEAYVTARLVAISHAEAGHCEDAINWMQRAITLAEANWQHPWVAGQIQRAQVLQALQRNKDDIAGSRTCTVVAGDSSSTGESAEHPGRNYALQYCQSCHLFVEPGMLPKQVWKDYVIPMMGALLGMHHAGYDYDVFPGKFLTEQEIITRARVYPDQALVPGPHWDLIVDYLLDSAPASPATREYNPEVSIGLDQFQVVDFGPSRKTPMTTLVHINDGQLFVGDYNRSSLTLLDAAGSVIQEISTPHAPVALRRNGRELWVTDIGSVFPSDMPFGKLLVSRRDITDYGAFETRLPRLRRPTHTTYGDVNLDGIEDIIVSEFGHFTGQFVWYEGQKDGGYTPHVLLNEPGSITSYLHDLNGDDLKDIAVVLGQNREGIHFFYNLGNGALRHAYVLPLPPTYGSNFFALHDFNADGHPDILATNGDNADHANPFPKPHHGIRVYLNDGDNVFSEAFFFPLYGASKALAVDFDNDGDLDIAGIAMFADFARHPESGFVYLENQGDLQFNAAYIPEAADGRWLTMDAGDLDGDNDIDIVLGSFIEGAGAVPEVIRQRWADLQKPLLYLENQHHR